MKQLLNECPLKITVEFKYIFKIIQEAWTPAMTVRNILAGL